MVYFRPEPLVAAAETNIVSAEECVEHNHTIALAGGNRPRAK